MRETGTRCARQKGRFPAGAVARGMIIITVVRPPLTTRSPSGLPADAMLRVLVVDHTAELSGGEVALARLLHEVDRTRYEVQVLLLADGPLAARLRDDGVPVTVLPAPGRLTRMGRAEAVSSPVNLVISMIRTVALIPRLTSAIRAADADIIDANTLKAAVLVSLCAPLSLRHWVWHVHDRIAGDYLPGAMVRVLRTLAERAPSAVIANSNATRDTLPGVPDDRIVVAYPGLDTRLETPERHPAPSPTFGLLGRIAPTKGQPEFLRAAAIVAEGVADARFSVIGEALFNDAEFADSVRALPADLGIADRVTFSGWAADPASAIADLTALVHASPVPEPFGQVLVEGMLAGVPVIGTNAGGVPEILDPTHEGVSIASGVIRTPFGLLAEPGDPGALARAMTWVLEHNVEATAMAVRARTAAQEKFDIRMSARRTEQTWTFAAGRERVLSDALAD
jgi:glycosyltransferase involved in cell wall biosynthesis